ncbi:MAG: pseudouridine synthase [Chthoniobacteraceae bacterium]|nr:pseudouridine synthase [Chthoniobacteraceae bacterium]
MRLNRFLASAGLGSRRSCEELIRTGQVTINGVQCENLATTVEPSDVVKVGQRVLKSAAPMTLLLHKPPGYLCTASDTHDRQTIFDLLPTHFPRLFHVGRLDRDSEGLLLMTNDGDLALKLTHPRYKVEKEYEVVLNKPFDFELTAKLLHGISLEEGWAKAEEVHKLGPNKVKVILRQGLKRQIRKMFYALGYEVEKLVRVRIGKLQIGDMPAGSFRALTQKEIEGLVAEGAAYAASAPEEPAHTHRPRRPAYRPPYRQAFSKRPAGEEAPRPARGEEAAPSDRPRRPAPAKFRARGGHAAVEEISFVPRASRPENREGRPGKFSARPGAKPAGKFGAKPWLRPKPGKAKQAKPAGKPAPRPFAKFERRRPE